MQATLEIGWWLDRADFYDTEWFPGTIGVYTENSSICSHLVPSDERRQHISVPDCLLLCPGIRHFDSWDELIEMATYEASVDASREHCAWLEQRKKRILDCWQNLVEDKFPVLKEK